MKLKQTSRSRRFAWNLELDRQVQDVYLSLSGRSVRSGGMPAHCIHTCNYTRYIARLKPQILMNPCWLDLVGETGGDWIIGTDPSLHGQDAPTQPKCEASQRKTIAIE